MDADNSDKEWKKALGFPINYTPEGSEDDFDHNDVVFRRPRQSEILLADGGDGAEADLLGTTPPRELRRDKKKRKTIIDSVMLREGRRMLEDSGSDSLDRFRNRLSLKLDRTRARDWKQAVAHRDKSDSLPSPNPLPAVPTLVESCNRFMSLTSRLKSPRDADGDASRDPGADVPANRVSFHETFSMLINMGNVEKGCRRTISREEQVWQNELKDLIWLELQARIAGRTLAEQDAFLCSQRKVVPHIVQNIRNYRFVNPKPCRNGERRLGVIEGSSEDLRPDSGTEQDDIGPGCCLSLGCQQCSDAVGKAMYEVGTLLDSFYNAHSLYPSSQAMTADHALIATQLFQNRIKAMCLWYNTAHHMRMKMMAVRRMTRTLRMKERRRGMRHLLSTDSTVSGQSFENHRQCQVRFNISPTATDSNNSDSSGQSEVSKETDSKKECQGKDSQSTEEERTEKSKEELEKSDQEGNKTEEKDEVDRGLDKTAEQSQPTTPEIIIDSRYGTADTVASTESGYTSSAQEDSSKEPDDIYRLGSLDDLTELRLLNKCPLSVFRTYHHEILKTAGVRRCMRFMNKMRCNLLHKVYCTLEKPDQTDRGESTGEEEHPVEVFGDAKDEDERHEGRQDDTNLYELTRYGCWSEECIAMRLPSYRNHFLLLGTICLEATHDYLELRLEDRPNEPSCLTIKQLIHELKEGLDIATDMRAAFARNISVALAGKCSNQAGSLPRQDLLLILRTFDNTVETVFKQYLSYLHTMSAVEWMSRSVLQTEWLFTARLARRLKCAALLAPPIFAEIACNQLDRLHDQFKKKFEEIDEMSKSTDCPDKQFVYAICRAVQQIYASERDATLQSAHWARALAAKLAKRYRPQRANIAASLMRIRDLIVSQTKSILEHSQQAAEELCQLHNLALAARIREMLLQIYRFGFELHRELYRFAAAPSEAPRAARPASLQPVKAPRPLTRDRRRRPETMLIHESFNPMIHKELHRFVREPPPAGRGRVTSQSPSKGGGRGGGAPRYSRQYSDGGGGDDVLERLIDINSFGETQVQSSIELLLSGEPPQTEDEGVELRNPEWKTSDEDRELATRVARAVVEFAKCWMQFVVERCDTGRGLRPRWASQGLEFLMLACDPCNTKHLTEAEFEDLKKMMDGCISHVIGSRPVTSYTTDCGTSQVDHGHRRRPRLHSPLPSREPRGAIPSPPSPPSEPDPLLSFPGIDCEAHTSRVMEAVREVERRRDEELRTRRAVGTVVEAAVSDYEPKLRQLKFKWQRGLKIGQGTFGKVYTVVNTESGQLLAMKELAVGAGDRRALHRAANELRVLEGVLHPHLVRYYGAELHREELLLFMELCVEGSLEALVGTWGALGEQTVRRYARQLVSAVAELHARAIAHRDIKSGNIFLTNEGHCLKLGDFGCAVKIRANTTAAGELIGHVGTQAYMAPEVFMKSTGHGRAADIWSVGCVVTEMASGKRPFSEYDSNVQIMFVVGMGGRPAVPDALSQEGRDFCLACLTHEPDARPRADQLSTHHFLMLKSDDTEDCKCEPAYLM